MIKKFDFANRIYIYLNILTEENNRELIANLR